jgi:hypothetical protein
MANIHLRFRPYGSYPLEVSTSNSATRERQELDLRIVQSCVLGIGADPSQMVYHIPAFSRLLVCDDEYSQPCISHCACYLRIGGDEEAIRIEQARVDEIRFRVVYSGQVDDQRRPLRNVVLLSCLGDDDSILDSGAEGGVVLCISIRIEQLLKNIEHGQQAS